MLTRFFLSTARIYLRACWTAVYSSTGRFKKDPRPTYSRTFWRYMVTHVWDTE